MLKTIIVIICLASLYFFPELAIAIDPHKNVIVPFLAAEEMEIEMNFGTRTHGNNPSAPRESSTTLGYGYAFTNFYKSELLILFNQNQDNINQHNVQVETIQWENHLLFTERGQYFIDPGIFWELEKSLIQGDGFGLVIGGLFRKDIKKLEVNFNPYLEKIWTKQEAESALMGFQWQAKYRFLQTKEQSTLSIGAQGFGDLGPWNHWLPLQDQTHRIGPALFYRWRIHDEKSLNGSVAYLVDVSKRQWTPGDADNPNSSIRSSAQTFRAMIEFQF